MKENKQVKQASKKKKQGEQESILERFSVFYFNYIIKIGGVLIFSVGGIVYLLYEMVGASEETTDSIALYGVASMVVLFVMFGLLAGIIFLAINLYAMFVRFSLLLLGVNIFSFSVLVFFIFIVFMNLFDKYKIRSKLDIIYPLNLTREQIGVVMGVILKMLIVSFFIMLVGAVIEGVKAYKTRENE